MKNLIICFFTALLLSGCWVVSEGERVGIVTKTSKTGLICKTNEGHLSVGFTKNGTGTVSKEDWEFTVEDDAVFEQIKKAAEASQPVKLFYRKEWVSICRAESDSYFVWKVEALK